MTIQDPHRATLDVNPHLTASRMNAIFDKRVDELTVQDVQTLTEALKHRPGAFNTPASTLLVTLFP